MSGRPKSEHPLSEKLALRISKQEFESWKKASGGNLSPWIRDVCNDAAGGGGPVNVIQSAHIEGLSEPPKAPRPPVPKLPGLVRGSDIPSPKQSFVVATDRLGKPEMVPAREDQVAPVREPQPQCINCNHFEGDRTGDPIALGDKYGWLCKECR